MIQESPVMSLVRSFILGEFLPGEDAAKLTPTTPLMTAGILDSIATLKLIMFLEEQFGVQIEAEEANEANLNTLQSICRLIESKR